MMRNTLLSRAPPGQRSRARSPSPAITISDTPPPPRTTNIPSIRLVTATPSAAGDVSVPSIDSFTYSSPRASPAPPLPAASSFVPRASPLAPRAETTPRKTLVPKKSKLGLLTGSKSREKKENKQREKDLSDVLRRVGQGSGSISRQFDIYVDPMHDSDIGELVVIKKKKSRVALDGMSWGTLGEVTNVPHTRNDQPTTNHDLLKAKEGEKKNSVMKMLKASASTDALRVKGDDKDKWWSIGRIRRDSKEKTKEKNDTVPISEVRPAPVRAHSLDGNVLLAAAQPAFLSPSVARPLPPVAPATISGASFLNSPYTPSLRSRPSTPGLLAVPTTDSQGSAANGEKSGSIAIRAMRSMRSLANIAGWARSEKDGEMPSKPEVKDKDKKKKKKEKEKKTKSVRSSSSSWEIGQLSPEKPVPFKRTLSRRGSIDAATLLRPSEQAHAPATVTSRDVPTLRQQDANRLSAASSGGTLSTYSGSSGSSLLPSRRSSLVSKHSKLSSGSSIRWDDNVDAHKEQRRRERAEKASSIVTMDTKRSSVEARKRGALSSIFPSGPQIPENPMVMVEEATSDGHGAPAAGDEYTGDYTIEAKTDYTVDSRSTSFTQTPKKNRVRPASEQLLGKSRPPGFMGEEGVISKLREVNDDLASLINRLDLQATPSSTPNGTPSQLYQSTRSTFRELRDRPSVTESPTKGGNMLRSSVTSLRPYSQSRSYTQPINLPVIGQQIAPWPALQSLKRVEENPPAVPPLPSTVASPPPTTVTFRPTHKRTFSPAPDADPMPVFQPLQPAKSRSRLAFSPVTNTRSAVRADEMRTPPLSATPADAPGSATFGSRPSKSTGPAGPVERDTPSPSPVFKNPIGHSRRNSSVSSISAPRRLSAVSSSPLSLPFAENPRRSLALSGTMGSTISAMALDPEDPDSDIPDELQAILANGGELCPPPVEDTMSLPPIVIEAAPSRSLSRSPGLPPRDPLPEPERLSIPVFRAHLIDDHENEADIEGGSSSEDNTTKSFDFTGELRRLNESGASDRLSFVEQVEKAFATPAPITLKEFEVGNARLSVEIPALPPLPLSSKPSRSSFSSGGSAASSPHMLVDMFLPGVEHASQPSSDTSTSPEVPRSRVKSRSSLGSSLGISKASSKPSNGELNANFKFGGRSSAESLAKQEPGDKLTLSDIIPPVGHRSRPSQSFVEEESEVLKAIYAQATSMPPPAVVPAPRSRVMSNTSLKRLSRLSQASEASFKGFDSFADVRRGFEFGPGRPAFYPPPSTRATRRHVPNDSMFSIASISSYGNVIDSGNEDPFNYGHHSRAPSEDVTMSMEGSINDTFSFIHHAKGGIAKGPYPMIGAQRAHRRAGSRASVMSRRGHVREDSFFGRRGHRRDESFMSVASGPPISLYNRSFGHHRRNDSNFSIRGIREQDSSTSASSLAHAYTMLGANAGRAAWAKHRQDDSVDTVASDLSMMRLGRPGVGDKMFDSSMPLHSISASPPESESGEQYLGNRTSYDSIMDGDRRSYVSDSLFENTGDRTSVSSGSVFGWDPSAPRQLFAPTLFRPVSMYSLNSIHSSAKPDDTMISVVGGGARVRRKSIGSIMEASPCVRVEKRKHSAFEEEDQVNEDMSYDDSLEKAQIMQAHVVRPSLASTSSHFFGEERMTLAQKGLLARQSLENSCLVAEGEEGNTTSSRSFSFARPTPAMRPRSNTSTTVSSEGGTPPLSPSSGSSFSDGSQSSIDLSSLSDILANFTHPMTNLGHVRPRNRARGQGHRRRPSQMQSRGSVYETIEEEVPSPVSVAFSKDSLEVVNDSVLVVDHEYDTAQLDDERGIVEMRRYYALRDEAQITLTESRRAWMDTPFSVFAVQTFHPPESPHGMQALLEQSQKTYTPLPEELRLMRLRTRRNSRPSPYPRSAASNVSLASKHTESNLSELHIASLTSASSQQHAPLQQISINPNILSPPPALDAIKSISPFAMFGKPAPAKQAEPIPRSRPRVPSTTRRNALGWSKRTVPKSEENKENTPSRTVLMSPNESLRLSRPRPRGRPTPARQPLRA